VGTDDEHTGRVMTLQGVPILFAYAPVGHYENYPDDVEKIIVRDFRTRDFILVRDFVLNMAPDSIASPDVGLFLTTSPEFLDFRKQREDRMQEAIAVLKRAPKKSIRNQSLIAAGGYLERNLSSILDSNDQYLKDYFILQEKWPQIVQAAQRFKIEELF
jgi:hypothetical protein